MIVVAAAIIAVLPAFVAYRYTAPQQRGAFVLQPWRGWAFAFAAVAVPGDSELKTSGMALRRAEQLLRDTAIDPQEVQLLFAAQNEPYAFTNTVGSRDVTATVTPSYRFIWQVRGALATMPDFPRMVVLLLDYRTGRTLYDVRDDLLPEELAPPANPEPAASR